MACEEQVGDVPGNEAKANTATCEVPMPSCDQAVKHTRFNPHSMLLQLPAELLT